MSDGSSPELPPRSLADSANDILAVLGADGRVAYVNAASLALLGYPPEMLVGRDVRELVHADDRRELERSLAARRAHRAAPVAVRCRVRHADGGHRMLEVRASPAGEPSGHAGALLVARDITDGHRREKLQQCLVDGLRRDDWKPDDALARCCAALKDLFGLVMVFAARQEPDGTLRMVAHACDDDVLLKEIIEVGLCWKGPAAIGCLARVIESGQLCRCGAGSALLGHAPGAPPTPGMRATCALPLKGGEGVFGVLVLCAPDAAAFDDAATTALLTEFGAQLGLILDKIARDARLALLGGALSAAANAIFITDRDAVIEWVNDAFVALTGYARDEVIGRTPRLLRSGLQDAEYYRTLKKTIRGGESWCGEITNRRRDGTLYTAQQTITPILEGGRRVRHFVAIQQDITERKRMEREIRELALGVELARQLERGQIAREVHDELGGSLVSLRHDIEWLIARTADAASVERLQIMLELAIQSLASARHIVHGLRPAVVEELGLIEAIGWLARDFRQHHELDIRLELAPELARVPAAQAAETFRVVQECLTNVAKHANAREVRINGQLIDQLLVFEVVDDGVGPALGAEASGRRGMTERALLMGGYLEIGAAQESGTRVRLVAPLAEKEAHP